MAVRSSLPSPLRRSVSLGRAAQLQVQPTQTKVAMNQARGLISALLAVVSALLPADTRMTQGYHWLTASPGQVAPPAPRLSAPTGRATDLLPVATCWTSPPNLIKTLWMSDSVAS